MIGDLLVKLRISPRNGEPLEREIRLGASGRPVELGRAAEVELEIDGVSRRHFALRVNRGEQVMVEDLGSKNGTTLNGDPIGGPALVVIGDVLEIRGSTLRVLSIARVDPLAPPKATTLLDAHAVIGQSFDGFEIRKVLSRDGLLGPTLLAHQAFLSRDVQLQVLGRSGASMVKRFENVARVSAGLAHPHIVTTYQTGFAEPLQRPYIVREHFAGEPLATLLADGRTLPVGEALELARQIGEALAYAHERKILHRNVTSTSILIQRYPEASGADGVPLIAKLTGLDLAKATDDQLQLTRDSTAMGDIRYIAPEQFASARDVGVAADIYSLAACVYQALTGRLPIEAATRTEYTIKIADTKILPPPPAASVPPALAEALNQGLQYHPEDRPASVAALVEALFDAASPPDESAGDASSGAEGFQAVMGSDETEQNDPDLEIGRVFRPLGGMGGDFYAVFELGPERLGVVVGDIAGHGPEAAALASLAVGVLRAEARRATDPSPAKILAAVNDELLAQLSHMRRGAARSMIPTFLGVFDRTRRTFRFCSAGSPPTLYVPAAPGQLPVDLKTDGMPLCVTSALSRIVKDAEIPLAPGDLLLLFTDGVFEAADPEGEEFGCERVRLLLSPGAAPAEVVARVDRELEGWRAGGEPDDDITLLALRVRA